MKTVTTLPEECKRLQKQMRQVLDQGSLTDEVPTRIHCRDTDAGGAPEWHPTFEKWIDAERDDSPRRQTQFYEPNHRMHPQRLKRALRQVRRLAPREYDIMYLTTVLGFSNDDAREKINTGRAARGQVGFTPEEFLVLSVSGASLLLASY